jgi:hypothetical protein
MEVMEVVGRIVNRHVMDMTSLPTPTSLPIHAILHRFSTLRLTTLNNDTIGRSPNVTTYNADNRIYRPVFVCQSEATTGI